MRTTISDGDMVLTMANGGWYGTPEEWQRLEAPLKEIDPVIEKFAASCGIRVSRNAKEVPERSMSWGSGPHLLIQVYLESEAGPKWNVWLCCFEDRSGSRFWRTDFAVRGQALEAFQVRLPTLLEESFAIVEAWAASPDQLQFVTKLAPLPQP